MHSFSFSLTLKGNIPDGKIKMLESSRHKKKNMYIINGKKEKEKTEIEKLTHSTMKDN